MTATPTPSDLLALSEKATPGPFAVLNVIDDECLLGFGIEKLDQDSFDLPAPWYSIWLKVNEGDARFMVALVNWFRSQDWTRPSLSAQAVGGGWLPIEQGGKLPEVGTWAIVLTDTLAGSRPDLLFLTPDKPRFRVIPAQLRSVEDGWPLWQRWSLASGHACGLLEGDTHWQPLPPAPGTTPPQPADGGGRVSKLIELLTKYQGEYDTPCPDLTLRHRYRADVFAALAKFQPAGGES